MLIFASKLSEKRPDHF